MKQEQVYKDNGFNVMRVWGCEWKEQKKEEMRDPDNTGENIAVTNRLVIDKSLFGGRT